MSLGGLGHCEGFSCLYGKAVLEAGTRVSTTCCARSGESRCTRSTAVQALRALKIRSPDHDVGVHGFSPLGTAVEKGEVNKSLIKRLVGKRATEEPHLDPARRPRHSNGYPKLDVELSSFSDIASPAI